MLISRGEWKRRPQMKETTFDDARIRTATGRRLHSGAYYLEALIPWDAIGATPSAGSTWRGAIAIQTASDEHERTGMTWPISKPDGLAKGVEHWATWTFTE